MCEEIVLPGLEADLILQPSGNEMNWTYCFLEINRERTYLGAETSGYLVAHLHGEIAGIQRESSKQYELEGQLVHWVLSLSERHHVLYATSNRAPLQLIWQDAGQSPVSVAGTISLDAGHCAEWQERLGRLQSALK